MNDYTPTETDFIDVYVRAVIEQEGVPDMAHPARMDAQRGVAKIKADALREFGSSLIRNSDPEAGQRVFDPWDVDSLATNRADRIEGEA